MTEEAPTTLTWGELLAEATVALVASDVASPQVDARRIVEEVTGTSGVEYLAELERPATRLGVARFEQALARRVAGEPLQYVLGRWAFRRLDLFVDGRVLIPRPETEQVVEVALAELEHRGVTEPKVLDLGTGSGAIALAIASERLDATVYAVERSAEAVVVARANLAGIGRAATRVRILEGSWFEPLPEGLRGELDLIVSNPPYVAESDELPAEVARWEPAEALFAGPRGLDAIVEILPVALNWLAPGGVLLVEHAPQQAETVVGLALSCGFASAETREDLAGRPRMLLARRQGSRSRDPRPQG